jgi:hypothetical protein
VACQRCGAISLIEEEKTGKAEAKVVKVEVIDGIRRLTVRCPFCGMEHYHDGGPAKEELAKFLGHRLSRCRDRERKQYRLVSQDFD